MLSETYVVLASLAALHALLLLWLRGGLKEPAPAPQAGPQPQVSSPQVSIIVAARNEAANLPHLLQALRAQDYPAERVEVVIADDCSEDNSLEILAQAARDWPGLQVVSITSPEPGWSPKKWALQQAVARSRGEWLLLTDADCRPGPTWLTTLARAFPEEGVGMVIGPAPLTWAGRQTIWRRALLLESNSMDALAAAGLGRGLALTCTGRNLALRRETFDAVGGYTDIARFISGDDDLMLHKVAATGKWRIRFQRAPECAVPSPQPASARQFIAQRSRFASKGRAYFSIGTAPFFRLALVLLFLGNLAGAAGLALFVYGAGWHWLAIPAAGILAEGLLIGPYLKQIGQPFPPLTFILTGFIYPWYVVLFGIIGSLIPLHWKGRTTGVTIQ